MHNNYCRVCGFELDNPPWGENGDTPTWEICPCCGTEFGYEDCTVLAAKKRRANWIEQGTVWFKENRRPQNWILEQQLSNIPNEFA